jgi:hypothetical protein
MASPNQSTFDVVPPYRPGAADFNGAAKLDDQANPPDPQTMPNAAEWNTICLLLVAMGKVISSAVITVTVSAGTYSASQISAAGAAVSIGSITVTKNGTGDVSLTWPANTFPPAVAAPEASLNDTAAGMITCYAITNGVRIVMLNAAAAAADKPFTVCVN